MGPSESGRRVRPTRRVRVAFSNVHKALGEAGKANDASTVHAVRIGVSGMFTVNDPVVYLYGSSDAPSGVVFNMEPDNLTPYAVIDLAPEEEW